MRDKTAAASLLDSQTFGVPAFEAEAACLPIPSRIHQALRISLLSLSKQPTHPAASSGVHRRIRS